MDVFLNSVESVLSIVILIALGYILQAQGWFGESFGRNISSLITKIALPASIFVSVLKFLTRESLIELADSLIYPMAAVAISYGIAYGLVKILKIRRGRRGIFMNAVANANTIFIGLPLNIALFGDKSLPDFLVYYVTNTVSTWAVGIFLIYHDDPTQPEENVPEVASETALTDGKKVKARLNWKKLLPPPLIGFVVGVIFLLVNIPVPAFINATLGYVGSIVTPMSLIYIGIVLCNAGLRSIGFDRDTVAALLGRFILSPAILVFLILLFGSGMATMLKQTLIVQSAAPMLAVLPMLAAEANGDVKYATNLVTTSTVLFIVVVPILVELLQFI